MHGDGDDATSFRNIRKRALRTAKPPAQGGAEVAYLNAFLDARVWAMKQEEAHSDTTRVDTEQRVFLHNGNLNLNPRWTGRCTGTATTSADAPASAHSSDTLIGRNRTTERAPSPAHVTSTPSPSTATAATASTRGVGSASAVRVARHTCTEVPPARPPRRGTRAHRVQAVPWGRAAVRDRRPAVQPVQGRDRGSSGPVAQPVRLTRAPSGAPTTRWTRSSYRPRHRDALHPKARRHRGPATKTGRCQDAAQPHPSPCPAPRGWMRRRTLARPFTSTEKWLSATFPGAVGPCGGVREPPVVRIVPVRRLALVMAYVVTAVIVQPYGPVGARRLHQEARRAERGPGRPPRPVPAPPLPSTADGRPAPGGTRTPSTPSTGRRDRSTPATWPRAGRASRGRADRPRSALPGPGSSAGCRSSAGGGARGQRGVPGDRAQGDRRRGGEPVHERPAEVQRCAVGTEQEREPFEILAQPGAVVGGPLTVPARWASSIGYRCRAQPL